MDLELLVEDLLKGRQEVPGITIDGQRSKDLDDAIWLERDGNSYVAHVSIADVGSVVKVGSDIDRRARDQAFTHYFAAGNKPMLPRELSEGLLSLLEGEKKPTITVSIPVSDTLQVGNPTIQLTALTSAKKLSYKQADDIMGKRGDRFLNEAYLLAQGLFEIRRSKGAFAYFDKNRGLSTNEEGQVQSLDISKRYNAHLIVQEFMILANQSMAEHFVRNGIPGLFRNHQAKNIAQDRLELIRDMESIANGSNGSRLETVSERFSLVLERARYDPSVSSHYGLNIPAYMHFTSPIRRFVDLVNHRQLRATLLNEAPPYKGEDLREIGDQVNTLEREMKERAGAYMKERDRQRTRWIITNGDLDRSSGRDFYRVVKLAARDSLMDSEVEHSIYRRLESGDLEARVLYTVLLESDRDDEHWGRVREKTLSWLRKNPNHASTVIDIACNFGWSVKGFKTGWSGKGHNRIYTAVGCLKVNGETYTSDPQKASARKRAKHFAAVNLLEQVVGVSIPENDGDVNMLHGSQESAGVNYKGLLQKVAQRSGGEPTYHSFRTGKDHQPSFEAVAKLVVDGVTYESDQVSGSKKKSAEHLAAENLLSKLENLIEPRSEKVPIVKNQNYVGALQELLQKHQKNLPNYRFQFANDRWLCECAVLNPEGELKVYSGVGSGKNGAKRIAAELAFSNVEAMYQRR